ncbi:hypothetical protein N4P33_01150 [Streptomyces sp. 15-116A]|uniref:hypothetical protein n=1 Tax=Streptomyces sp. 15-116A TaxID=2259035 RepID=UPI0021B2E0D8|nr:hypothetical protein [Streptomyces sp. 15-116A]MCT7350790.1 hypothetical protein [Streptomyces sp. 15-116A]
MHRGGGLGEGTDDLGPRRARRGRHRREAQHADDAANAAGTDAAGMDEARQAYGQPGEPERLDGRIHGRIERLGPGPGSRNGGRVGVTYKYFGAPDGATAARVPISMRPEELGGDELGMGGMFTKIKPETMAAMVLTGIEGVPLHKVPPLELVVLHPDYAVVKLPMTVVDPLRGIGEEAVGAAAFIWSTVPDRGGPRDAFNVYQLLHEWQDFSHRLHEAGHQPYCLVWP